VYQNGYAYPDRAILTTAKNSDKSQLDELLITDPNALYVFDRGYVDYKKWDEYCEAGIRFVTRIKDNFIINIIDEKPVDGTNMTESTVILGSKKTMMSNKLRLIHIVDTKGSPVVILTNDFNIGAQEISEIYRRRWKVELFLKWVRTTRETGGPDPLMIYSSMTFSRQPCKEFASLSLVVFFPCHKNQFGGRFVCEVSHNTIFFLIV